MFRVGVIGYGYWGPNLVRCFHSLEGVQVLTVCDASPARRALAQRHYPHMRVEEEAGRILEAEDLDAVAIATPLNTHFDFALRALRSGKHVLVEKPICSNSRDAETLVEEARRRGLLLMVDHTFLYTGAVETIRSLIQGGELGELLYYDSVRVNLGNFHPDADVVWDLAPHDISILEHVLGREPEAVSAVGRCHVEGQGVNIAYLSLFFPGSLIAHFHVSWLSPVKLRRTLIGGSRKMLLYDDIEPSEKVRVYDSGVNVDLDPDPESKYRTLVSYRTGDVWIPRLDHREALAKEARHFVACARGLELPLSDGASGLRVVRVLEAVTRSIREEGKMISLQQESPA